MTRTLRTARRWTVALLGLGALTAVSPAQERPASPAGAVDLQKLKLDLLLLKTTQKALAAEREAAAGQLEAAPSAGTASDTVKLRLRLTELLARLNAPPVPPPARVEGPPAPSPDVEGVMTGQIVNALSLAQALYQSGNYSRALAAFRQVDLTALRAEERVPVQYLIATCLRKAGRKEEALSRYREVANSRLDPFVAECAQWQLATARWQDEMRKQIEGLKARRKALEQP
ncbi:MAG: hypothetical protein IT429_13010 [Gemmataceae bacterium]|nr:hypothetical protein [Gemmataceae bacterium]